MLLEKKTDCLSLQPSKYNYGFVGFPVNCLRIFLINIGSWQNDLSILWWWQERLEVNIPTSLRLYSLKTFKSHISCSKHICLSFVISWRHMCIFEGLLMSESVYHSGEWHGYDERQTCFGWHWNMGHMTIEECSEWFECCEFGKQIHSFQINILKECKPAEDKRSQSGQKKGSNPGKFSWEIHSDINKEVEVTGFFFSELICIGYYLLYSLCEVAAKGWKEWQVIFHTRCSFFWENTHTGDKMSYAGTVTCRQDSVDKAGMSVFTLRSFQHNRILEVVRTAAMYIMSRQYFDYF